MFRRLYRRLWPSEELREARHNLSFADKTVRKASMALANAHVRAGDNVHALRYGNLNIEGKRIKEIIAEREQQLRAAKVAREQAMRRVKKLQTS